MRAARYISLLGCAVIFLSLFAALQPPRVYGQARINDKDMESLMRNLRDDAKSFRPTFDAAIHKSIIRKTSQERDARDLAARFEKQTELMLNHFKQHRKGEADLQNVLSTASQVDKLVYGPGLDGQTTAKWEKVRAELREISSAYGVSD